MLLRSRIGDWNTSAAISRIVSKDGLEFVLGNRDNEGRFFTPEPWGGLGQPWLFPPPGVAANLILAKNAIETRNTQIALSAEKPYTEESGWGATVAYTFTDAVQNRDINEHYVFDGPSVTSYPFIRSNAAAKHRLVATGTARGPWDLLFGAKLTLASPIPFNGILLPVITAFLGGYIYPIYRTGARVAMEEMHLNVPLGFFDMKEHYIAIGLGMLPAYWYYWRQPLAQEHAQARAMMSAAL